MKTSWISTEKAMPPPNEWIIVCYDRYYYEKRPSITIGSYEVHPGSVHAPFWIIGPTMKAEDDLTAVTHWMPLPPPPEPEEEEPEEEDKQ